MPTRRLFAGAACAALCLAAAPALAEPPAPPPLEAYGDLPGVEMIAMSPSGTSLATVAEIEGTRRLLVIDADKKLRASTTVGDVKVRSLDWAGEDMVIVDKSVTTNLGPGFTTDKAELFATILVPLAGGKSEMLFARNAALARATFGEHGLRQINGHWYGFYGGVELGQTTDHTGYYFEHNRPSLFQVDLATNVPRKIANSADDDHRSDWLIDGDGKVGASFDISSVSGAWRITNAHRDILASGVDHSGHVHLVSFGKDGSTAIYSVVDPDGEANHWFEVPLAGGDPHEVFADLHIERGYFDPNNDRLLGYLPKGEPPRPVLFDPAKQAILNRIYRAFPKLDVAIEQWTSDMSHFLVHTSGNGDSGTWFVVDVPGRRADAVGYERPGIAANQVGPISTVAYKAGDGLALDGILTLPPGREAKNLPVVIFPHGGPHARDVAAFDWWAQAFAARGYAVFQPNFRGSTNRDRAFMTAGDGQWGRKMQTDVSDGLAELVRQGVVDRKRACIMGASYGGYAALACVTLQHGLYRCAVAVAGVSDLAELYQTDYSESGEDRMVRTNLKADLGDPKTFAEVSPRRHAGEADAPVLLIHGKDDTVVAYHQSTAMQDALKNAGKPVEFVTLAQEDHWLSRAATRKQMLSAAMAFVQKYNPPDGGAAAK